MRGLNKKQEKAVGKLKEIDPESEIFWDSRMKIPKFVKGTLSKPSAGNPETIARKFLEEYRELPDMQPGLDESLELFTTETDFSGFHHVIFLQHIKGIPVFEGSVQVHINPAGEVIAYKDFRLTEVPVALEPKIKREEAIEIVHRDIGSEQAAMVPRSKLMLFRDSEIRLSTSDFHLNKLHLKEFRFKKLHLVWQVESIFAEGFAGKFHFIDAHTGEQLYTFSQIRSALFRKTYTAKNESILPGELLHEDQLATDEVARAAHKNMGIVYDYYKNTFGRDSYDNKGSPLVSSVHFLVNYNNSFWSDYHKQLVFGDGDGFRWRPMALALDIVAHELTHAVAAQTARFVYSEEAGALDESFADVFATFISNEGKIENWEIGEGVYTPFHPGDALRDLSDPPRFGQPDHIDNYVRLAPGEIPDLHKNRAGYIHLNSGILNKAAYLTIKGGTHYGIKVKGISRAKAEKIYYLALTEYLSSATLSRWTFREARYSLLNACRQLYGEKGPEYAAINNSWAAVGLGTPKDLGDLFLVEKEAFPGVPIPDLSPDGILSSIYVPTDGLVKDIRVSVNIEHPYLRDLRLMLFTPAGSRIVLHDRQARRDRSLVRTYNLGSVPALETCVGERAWGRWNLKVEDLAREHKGSFRSWGLKFLIRKVGKEELKREIFPFLKVPDNDPKGIESSIEVERRGKIVSFGVSLEITHPSIRDLEAVLVIPSGEELVLHNRTGYGKRDLKKTFSTESDEFLLPAVNKEMKGIWTLKVTDREAGNEGNLDSWGMCITYESDPEFL
ncbi:Zinc metalloproteinase precursor [Methanosarcina siciliae T4/M]|uniref:Zinc metalloproteinase n=2 Tax=Methanosarcina siciliae TaxID=38027 RepID=A0A0E3PD79_9EURY|nr:M4 family metallopeptidase [Methanosarcina siciliae]AKB28492.1 Zinc metalloproteinase precursor [Methanosarcina siciliae T4/M]AKB32408.1 Zinc metalloproteinase precursor [Methanosarcina siciliae HI350]